MKLAIISDVHGNAFALEAVLRDLEDVAPDSVVCLGDMVQAGAQPAECVDILREKKWPVVMGNADAWLVTGVVTNDEGADDARKKILSEVREWSLSRLSEEDKAFILAFAPNITIDLTPDAECLCFHGSPDDFDEVLLPSSPNEDFAKHFQKYEQRMMCGGHTHIQFIHHYGKRFFFNPGSVGFAPRHGPDPAESRLNPWAEYAILTATRSSLGLEFRRVGYDVEKLKSIYKNSGRPNYQNVIAQYA